LAAVLEQMHRLDGVVQPLQVQSDAHPVGSRAAKIAVQNHRVSCPRQWRRGLYLFRFSILRESSRGSGKAMFSSTPSRARTRPTPSSRRRSMTWLTSTSGAEAPAVTPTRFLPTSQAGSIISGL